MMKSIIAAGLLISLFVVEQKSVFAAEVNPDEFKSAIQAVVTDGIIKNRDSKAVFELNWNLLPVTEGLIQNLTKLESIEQKSITFVQSNKNNINILCDLKPDDQLFMYEALGFDERNSTCDKLQPKNILIGTFQPKPIRVVELEKLFKKGSSIKSSDYIAMTTERNILETVLRSRGIKYALDLRNSEELEIPNFSDKNITWQIKIYKYNWLDKDKISYYRFSIKAKVERFEKNNFSVDKKNLKYDARISFKDSETLTKLINPYFSAKAFGDDIKFEESSIFKEQTETASTNISKSLSSLSDVFNIIGGGEQLSSISQGLLSGTDNSSVVSGGLFNFKNGSIDPLIGINRELTTIGDASVGVVYGVGLGQKTSLFLGPSIQESIFTLSAGATLGSGQQSELGFAGLVSIDLSRATNSKKNINTVELKSSSDLKDNSDQNIRTEIEKDIKNRNLIGYRINSCPTSKSFKLNRIDNKVPTKIVIKTNDDQKNDLLRLVYLPRGDYEYDIDKISVFNTLQNVPLMTGKKIKLDKDMNDIIEWRIDCK
jgi:hypothetical protein